uniref:Uncharacterized protein n=1 Tax=Oxytricha trifallax TaxID=1172189 RepID=G9HRC2_9SPIT|nr:hypothetical protein [Oxytricha trifallax]
MIFFKYKYFIYRNYNISFSILFFNKLIEVVKIINFFKFFLINQFFFINTIACPKKSFSTISLFFFLIKNYISLNKLLN